jgi:hypothetical protein
MAMDDRQASGNSTTDRNRVADETEPRTAEELEGALGPDQPSTRERTGLGDVGQYGDAAATGETGAEAESLTEEGLDRFADGDMAASSPVGPDEQPSRVSQTGGLDAEDASRQGPGTTRDAQTNSPGTG